MSRSRSHIVWTIPERRIVLREFLKRSRKLSGKVQQHVIVELAQRVVLPPNRCRKAEQVNVKREFARVNQSDEKFLMEANRCR